MYFARKEQTFVDPQSVYIPSINSVVYISIHAHFLMSQWKNLNLLKVP